MDRSTFLLLTDTRRSLPRLPLVAAIVALIIPLTSARAQPVEEYKVPPESVRHSDVPEGTITKHEWTSEIFDGTRREYFVYVPAQYDGLQPACVMVFQDGHAYVSDSGDFKVPIVFDNLIHQKQMPVTIGIFINPGHRGDRAPQSPWRASNRSFEYDTLSDQYARFLLDEIIPAVQNEHELNLSSDPADRAIGGISSGGICAFTAAWERPDAFSKVLSHVGSFTNIRGGHDYAAQIRKTSNKPIRVFLQDGSNDLNNEHGNWWLANLQMASSLAFKDYDFRFVGGEGGHNGKHGGAILPDSLRWLWRDHVVDSVGAEAEAGDTEPVEELQAIPGKVDAGTAYESLRISYTGGEYENEEFAYRLLRPQTVDAERKYPLVVFLHGAGERGEDNSLQLQYLPTLMAQPKYRERFPCYVLAPQCRNDHKWVEVDWSSSDDHSTPEQATDQIKAVLQMLQRTLNEESVDPHRVYLTGLSMGGYGTWDLAVRYPEAFAAVAPICGGGDTSRMKTLVDVPIWVAHGAKDGAVPIVRSRRPVEELRRLGGHVTYVEYPEGGHNVWTPAYEDYDGLLPWMFRQRNPRPIDIR